MRHSGSHLIITSIILFATASIVSGIEVRRIIVKYFTPGYRPNQTSFGQNPTIDKNDAMRQRIPVQLKEVASGFSQPTDTQFFPNNPSLMVVLEQMGHAKWFDLKSKKSGEWFKVDVTTISEQGLLGLAFHSQFPSNGRFFINYTTKKDGREISRIEEWYVNPAHPETSTPKPVKTIMEVDQPYSNHNAGQLAFGPDGFLYIGFGDGGWMGDPHNNGQNPSTLLGSMLRIDINHPDPGKAYGIPKDNPFINHPTYRPETWAYGLRNPWRYSFDPQGRLIVADVGQDLWEEIDIVEKGKNYGWNIREARHCFRPKENCKRKGLTDPIYEYTRDDGGSITGGYVYLGEEIPALKEKYILGDFLSGRVWALDLPKSTNALAKVYALGKWPMLISTFGRDAQGNIYLADFASGKIYRIIPG